MTVLQGFQRRFLLLRDKEWFCEGLVIESASDRTAAPVLARIHEILPLVKWDLLSRHPRPGFRFLFHIKRPLGGVRLLFSARKHYEIVVFFYAAGDRDLRLHNWLALLLMRPRRFFVFIEGADGFWLAAEDARKIRNYVNRCWGFDLPAGFWEKLEEGSWRWRDPFVWAARAAGRAIVRVLRVPARGIMRLLWVLARGLRWVGLLFYATGTFLLAVLLLGFFRLFYDTYYYRFRFFGNQVTLHPGRDLGGEEAPAELCSRPPAV